MVATALQQNLPGSSSASTTANAGSAAPSSTLETMGKQPTASEQQRISDLQQQFQQQAQQDPAGFRSAMRAAFGDKASLAEIDQLLDLALADKLPMPQTIQFVEAGSLGSGALGAYDASDGGALYLDRSLLSDPEKLQSVFNEEMGHHLDTLLGGVDAAGDEGAVFSRTLEQGTLSQSDLTALKSENDQGFITVDGKTVAVEFRNEDEGSGNGQSPGPSPAPSYSGPGSSQGTGGSPTPSSSPGTDGGPPGTGGSQPPSGTNDRDGNTGGHQNGESESDKAGGTQRSNSGGGQVAGDGTSGRDDTEAGGNGATTGENEQTQTKSATDSLAAANTQPEPEKQGFWSRALDSAADVAASGLSFVANSTPLPDLTPAEARQFLGEEQDGGNFMSEVTADDGVVTTIGSYEYDYEPPDFSSENKTVSAGFKAEIDGTAHTVETQGQIGPVDIEGTRKVGAANANASLEGALELSGTKTKINGEASIGAEVMGVDAKAEGSISFSTQGIFDKGAEVYNATVDHIHESIVGHDVPDMQAYDVPDVFDREITISAHVEGGLGASAKYSGGANIGRTDDSRDGLAGVRGATKVGLGPVIGVGASIVIE